MFIGHFGVGFAAKKVDNRPSLGTMFIAAQFLDLIWPVLILLDIEKVKIEPGNPPFKTLDFLYYPFSHSLLSTVLLGILFGGIYYLVKKNLKGSILLGSLVVSHWILDLFTHVPDLPLFPWSDIKVGLGLWNSVPVTIIIETAIFIGGVYFYISATHSKNLKGSFGLWGLVGLFLISYIMSIVGATPPNVEAIGFAGLSMWLFVIWAYWVDRNRSAENEIAV